MKIPGSKDNENTADGAAVLMPPGEQLAPVKYNAFNIETINTRLEPFKAKIYPLAEMAENFVIKTDADFERSAEMTGQAKNIIKAIDGAVRSIIDDYYNFYKSGLNMGKALTSILDARVLTALETTQNNYSYQKEIARRAAEQKARDEVAAFQKKLDAEAKKQKVAPVQMAPVPVIPKQTAPVKTQSGSMTSKMVWDFEFEDFKTKEIFDYVLKVCAKEYIEVANKAIKKMVKAGIHEGIKGVRFFERAETQHRSR